MIFYQDYSWFLCKVLIMNGDAVKKILRERKVKLNAIASSLGESPQNVSSMLNALDIKTGVIERISSVTGIPISEFFGEKSATLSASMTGGSNNRMIAGNENSMGDSAVELEALRRENELLKKWMAEKDGQIEFLRELLKK